MTKLASQVDELRCTERTNLTRAMKAKTNERVIQEVKQRKIAEEQIYERQRTAAELSKYQRMDAEKKYTDIRNLLMKMNVPVQGGKAEPI